MKKIYILLIASLYSISTLWAGVTPSIQGQWKGTRHQFNETKSKYIAEFDYEYTLTQQGNIITGQAKITSKSGKYANINLRGFVEGNKFYFEEYEIVDATRHEGFLWCLKKGVLDISTQEGKVVLSGKTPSFMEYYGYECTGGFTYIAQDQVALTDEAITKMTTPTNEEKSLQLSVYPNPFVAYTQINFSLQDRQPVTLDIIDIKGRVIETLVHQSLDQGVHNYTFTPRPDQNASYYYIRLQIGNHTYTKPVQKFDEGSAK